MIHVRLKCDPGGHHKDAKRNIQKIQAENKRTYDSKRKKTPRYQIGDFVAIQRTQFRSGLKLWAKFLGPYKIIEVIPRDRYNLERRTNFYGDHAPASSTTSRIIMSESSDYMELSPTKFDQVSTCEKLRDTVTGISALHLSIHGMDERSPSPRNSFMYMYISGKQAMIRRKEEMFTCCNCGGVDRGSVAIYRPFGEVSLSLNRTVTCMVLKANDRRTSCPCHDEFRGPRSDYVR
ncbi:uncharacterized protein TNCV_82201 [Trichonephila clavipes]|nr:uncharacterized protein TNCV_82201 [Trichonephila clavipes]